MAWEFGQRKIISETDSSQVIELVQGDISMMHADKDLIREHKTAMAKDWLIRICYFGE